MPGVQMAFAIQAGREVRVVVQPNVVTDDQAHALAKTLRLKIEQELDYPSNDQDHGDPGATIYRNRDVTVAVSEVTRIKWQVSGVSSDGLFLVTCYLVLDTFSSPHG